LEVDLGRLSKEDQVLLQCARIRSREKDDRREKLRLDEGLNWEKVVGQAEANGIASLLYRRLEEDGEVAPVPPGVMEVLKRKYHATGFRNLALHQDLAEILRAINEKGIPVIVLKGALLADSVYSNVGLRAMSDLDLLIPPESVKVALDVLKKLGYSHAPDEKDRTHEYIIQHDVKLCLVRQKPRPVFLDLHWDLTSFPPLNRYVSLDVQEFWGRAERVHVGGEKALRLSPEDLVLHLCLHLAANHAFTSLIFYHDIGLVIDQSSSFDWDYLVRETRRCNLDHMVYTVLILTRTFTGISLPDMPLEAIRPSPVYESFLRFLLNVEGIIKSKPSAVHEGNRRLLHFLLVRHPLHALGMLRFLLLPERKWLKERYVADTFWTAYPKHLKNLSSSFLVGLRGLLSGLLNRFFPAS
jgi:hypothetical protein